MQVDNKWDQTILEHCKVVPLKQEREDKLERARRVWGEIKTRYNESVSDSLYIAIFRDSDGWQITPRGWIEAYYTHDSYIKDQKTMQIISYLEEICIGKSPRFRNRSHEQDFPLNDIKRTIEFDYALGILFVIFSDKRIKITFCINRLDAASFE